LEVEMMAAAEALEFERAAAIRDRIVQMRDSLGKQFGEVKASTGQEPRRGRRRRRTKAAGRVPRPKKPYG
jgi:excinuclease ABC subunit B